MKIYIDSDFKCHTTSPDGTFREHDVPSFDGRCAAFVEGHRCIPDNESWTRSDGVVFAGEMIAPWKPYNELAAAQAQYELDIAEAAAAYQEGVDSAYDQ